MRQLPPPRVVVALPAALLLALALPTSAAAPTKGALDQAGLEGVNELDLNPAAIELRETRAAAAALAKAPEGSEPTRPPRSLPAMAASCDIPITYNARVSTWLSVFEGSGRRFYSLWLARSHRWGPSFREILRHYGVPQDLLYQAMVESGLAMQAISSARAVGPWQFMRATGEAYDLRVNFWVDERRDPLKSTHAAARYLKDLHSKWNDWYLAWAEYNGGPGRVSAGVAKYSTTAFWALAETDALAQETRDYVPMIIAATLVAKHPDLFGFGDVQGMPPFEFDRVEVAEPTDLAVLAACARTTEAVLQELNPELLRFVTPPMVGGAYGLRIPKGRAADFDSCIRPSARVAYRGCRVQRGDTLRLIAQRFGADPLGIIQINRIEGRIHVGQELVVPVSQGPYAERP
jgi:membrane-bound lytic murein transglycosylase D